MPELLPESIQSFLDYLKYQKRYSALYHSSLIMMTLPNFLDFYTHNFGEVSLDAIGHNHVRSWLATIRERDITAKTINRKISSLKSFFKYMVKSGVLEQTPMVNVLTPKISKRLPDFITESDADKLMGSLENSEDWKGLNTKMLITLFYTTGMRLSELVNLKETQVDFAKKQVKVLGKGNKERIIPISQEAIIMIKDYIQLKKKEFEPTDNTLLVTEKGKKMYPKYPYLLVKSFLSSEVKTLNKKSPHVLRHTFATHLIKQWCGSECNKRTAWPQQPGGNTGIYT